MTIIKPFLLAITAFSTTFAVNGNASESTCDLLVSAKFDEGAPRDFFHITNESADQWSIAMINLDLTPSVGQLIFDTEAGGKGVEVFQLFDVVPGPARISSAAIPDDGESVLELSFKQFATGDTFSFSIDVDDQMVNSALGQIRVSGSEIEGSLLQVQLVNTEGEYRTQTLRFDDQSLSVVEHSGCPD